MITPADLEPLRLLTNSAPLDDFCGLSPSEMHSLLYTPFGDRSPVKVRAVLPEETLEALPFFRLTEEFLGILRRDGPIKLTPLGALPRKTLRELYDHHFILEELIEAGVTKLTREHDSIAIQTMHLNAGIAGLVRKTKGNLNLTKRGETLLRGGARRDLFVAVLRSFVEQFNWGYNDRYTDHPVGQLGWAFTIYLLMLFGDKPQTIQFYADKYTRAFPTLVTRAAGSSPVPFDNWFAQCYGIRTFERFLEWFGLVTIERERGIDLTRAMVVTTKGMTELFVSE